MPGPHPLEAHRGFPVDRAPVDGGAQLLAALESNPRLHHTVPIACSQYLS